MWLDRHPSGGEAVSCSCAACKRGEKIGTPKKTNGKDTRPWGVEVDGEIVVRCWYRDTARAWADKAGHGKVRKLS
jgi:hypothetical protein